MMNQDNKKFSKYILFRWETYYPVYFSKRWRPSYEELLVCQPFCMTVKHGLLHCGKNTVWKTSA